MATRKIKDAKDLDTGEKIYLKSHAKATFLSNGQNLEDALNRGEFLTRESADGMYQPKGNYLTEHQDISGKLDSATAASTYLAKSDAAETYLGKTAKAVGAGTADTAIIATNLATAPSLAVSGNNITVTAGGKTSTAFTVPYATSANSASSATKATQDASGNVITSTYATITSLNNKQDKNLYFTNVSASSWVADSTYSDFGYRCDVTCSGVTSSCYAEVVFDTAEAVSGNYAPVCSTMDGIVAIYSKVTDTITIPTIFATLS